MNKKGILLIISGFAGSGKGTVVKALVDKYDDYALSISATTRAPRPGEEEGKSYFFKTKEEFEGMIERGELLEHACYVGNYYGTPAAYVDRMLEEGKNVILEIDMQGAFLVKEMRKDALLIFLMPPDVPEIYNRLKKRGTEDEETIMKRMRRGAQEAKDIDKYDFLIINDEVEACADRLHNIVKAAGSQVFRSLDFIGNVREQFLEFLGDEE